MIRRVACFAGALFVLGLYACKNDDPHPAAAGEPPTSQPNSNVGGGGGVANDTGTSSSSGGTDTDEDGGLLDGQTGTLACTDVTQLGVVVDEEAAAQDPPAASGGTIANGTYTLTQVQKYVGASGGIAGPTGVTYQATIRITNGTTFERDMVIAANATGTGTEQRSSGIMVPVAPNLTITFNCPSQTQEQYTYTATTSSVVLTNITTRESYTYVLKL